MPNLPSLDCYRKYFLQTDSQYLNQHYARFCQTKRLVDQGLSGQSLDVMDIGAHWLHQSVLYALDGHRLTAADLPITLEQTSVQEIAEKHHMNIHTYADLSQLCAFDGLANDTFDVILFTEIIEHLTFNPVDMWKNLYRILRPGGKIIVTTPNYYYLPQILKRWVRLFKRTGGGLSVEQILTVNTMGPHWKEYSAQELKQYFQLLSADFSIGKLHYLASPTGKNTVPSLKRRIIQGIEQIVPIFRSGLYLEVELAQKKQGISLVPSW